ncbi:hypothetical protein T4E_10673 [Trichinella pseudospiralis]|uniref:Uncharacterized protein n=1 Tax=Trichinella pseudospiralis TaxID=6337 RepID=A0A0V0Y9D6_TRIPS|nr:hypothetical protein T4E_10673 [Trichinella pseudospiralis]
MRVAFIPQVTHPADCSCLTLGIVVELEKLDDRNLDTCPSESSSGQQAEIGRLLCTNDRVQGNFNWVPTTTPDRRTVHNTADHKPHTYMNTYMIT